MSFKNKLSSMFNYTSEKKSLVELAAANAALVATCGVMAAATVAAAPIVCGASLVLAAFAGLGIKDVVSDWKSELYNPKKGLGI